MRDGIRARIINGLGGGSAIGGGALVASGLFGFTRLPDNPIDRGDVMFFTVIEIAIGCLMAAAGLALLRGGPSARRMGALIAFVFALLGIAAGAILLINDLPLPALLVAGGSAFIGGCAVVAWIGPEDSRAPGAPS